MKSKKQKKENVKKVAKLTNIALNKETYNEDDKMMEAIVDMELEEDKIYKLWIVEYSGSRASLKLKNMSKAFIDLNIPEKEGNYLVNITLAEVINEEMVKSGDNHNLTANLTVKYSLKHKIKHIKITNITFKFGVL